MVRGRGKKAEFHGDFGTVAGGSTSGSGYRARTAMNKVGNEAEDDDVHQRVEKETLEVGLLKGVLRIKLVQS